VPGRLCAERTSGAVDLGHEQRGNNEDSVRRDGKVKILLYSLLGSASFCLICNWKVTFMIFFGFYLRLWTGPRLLDGFETASDLGSLERTRKSLSDSTVR
jgi:hypothetical protein